MPVGHVEPDDGVLGHPVEVLDQRPQAVAVGGDEHGAAGLEVGDDGVVPVRQHAHDDVGQALGAGTDLRRQRGVARVVVLRPRVVVGQGRRRGVVGAAPAHELLLAVLGQRLGLVLALQRAVVALVQPPRPAHRDPQPVGRLQRQLGRADGPLLQRRVHDVGQQVVLDEQRAAAHGLGHALLGEVDVDPAGEQVLLVPVALAVAEQHERADHRGDRRWSGREAARSRQVRRRDAGVTSHP